MGWLLHFLVPFGARMFFRACARWPGLFAFIVLCGLGVGVWAAFLAQDLKPDQVIAVRLIGLGCLGFYGFLLVMLIVKLRRGTWTEFCQWAASEFE